MPQHLMLKVTDTMNLTKRVGSLWIGGTGSIFNWGYVGAVSGNQQGQGMWLWDAMAYYYYADLYDADPATGNLVGSLYGPWYKPIAGSSPTPPLFPDGSSGDVWWTGTNGNQTQYYWWRM